MARFTISFNRHHRFGIFAARLLETKESGATAQMTKKGLTKGVSLG
jgi:hypothetical protein